MVSLRLSYFLEVPINLNYSSNFNIIQNSNSTSEIQFYVEGKLYSNNKIYGSINFQIFEPAPNSSPHGANAYGQSIIQFEKFNYK